MRVAVRPCFAPGISGGIEPYVQGLASALSGLEGLDRFEFLGTEQQRVSLAPHIDGAASWVTLPSNITDHPAKVAGVRARVSSSPLGPAARRAVRWLGARRPARFGPAIPPSSPEAVESAGYDVVHFAAQAGELTALPNLYQPWDLQHLHHPEFFTKRDLEWRELIWGPCCERATYVVVASRFVHDDVVDAYGIDPSKVAIVPPGAPMVNGSAERTHCGRPYALFPAQVWAHKNHERLIGAVARLRSRGIEVRLVCPGQPNEREGVVRSHARNMKVDDLVDFPGYVTSSELAGLYAGARCLIFPSLFEGFGFPVLEAFASGVPVACSSTTSLPELAADAAVLFDPTDIDDIADAVERVWTDDRLRNTLAAMGRRRAERYSWDSLARSCRALYRAAAGVDLEEDDIRLLTTAGIVPRGGSR